jgi:hypothetical protein
MALDLPYPTPDPAHTLATMSQWEAFFLGITGVIPGVGGLFAASMNSGARTVTIQSGATLIRGFYMSGSSATTFNVPAASAGNRVDRLVLRLDRTQTTAGAWITPVIIQGTSGSTTPPAVQTSLTNQWDQTICRWSTNSDGTLSGLVDERYMVGAKLAQFPSTARPPASFPGLGVESDTGRLMRADGTAWSVMAGSTAWITFPYASGYTSAGSSPGYGLVYIAGSTRLKLRGHIQKTSGASFSLVNGVKLGTLPSGYRPAATRYAAIATQYTTQAAARVEIDTNGAVIAQGPQTVDWVSLDGVEVDLA